MGVWHSAHRFTSVCELSLGDATPSVLLKINTQKREKQQSATLISTTSHLPTLSTSFRHRWGLLALLRGLHRTPKFAPPSLHLRPRMMSPPRCRRHGLHHTPTFEPSYLHLQTRMMSPTRRRHHGFHPTQTFAAPSLRSPRSPVHPRLAPFSAAVNSGFGRPSFPVFVPIAHMIPCVTNGTIVAPSRSSIGDDITVQAQEGDSVSATFQPTGEVQAGNHSVYNRAGARDRNILRRGSRATRALVSATLRITRQRSRTAALELQMNYR